MSNDIQITHKVKARHAKGSPIFGTELIYDENQTQGLTRVMVITGYFDGNNLVGNRSVWRIRDTDQKATLADLSSWTSEDQTWTKPDLQRAWVKHKKTLASFLMSRWSLGKLHGRINDTLE